jgi:hypothetical protein
MLFHCFALLIWKFGTSMLIAMGNRQNGARQDDYCKSLIGECGQRRILGADQEQGEARQSVGADLRSVYLFITSQSKLAKNS